VLCDFLALDGSAGTLSWPDVHAILPEVGQRREMNFVVISAIRARVLTDWRLAWTLAGCADAMGQRDVVRAAVRAGIAPGWETLGPDLDRIAESDRDDGDSPPWVSPQGERQRSIAVLYALEAGILRDAAAIGREVRRALGRARSHQEWYELTMLLREAPKGTIPAEVQAEADAALRAKAAADARRAAAAQREAPREKRSRPRDSRQTRPREPAVSTTLEGQLPLLF
jgi:hypothetical protein